MSSASITILRDDQTPQPAGLVWEQPPTRAKKAGRYAAIAAALRERPGQWAVIRTYPTYKKAGGFAGAIRAGKLVDFRDGRYEVQVHTVEGAARVYVRWVEAERPNLGSVTR